MSRARAVVLWSSGAALALVAASATQAPESSVPFPSTECLRATRAVRIAEMLHDIATARRELALVGEWCDEVSTAAEVVAFSERHTSPEDESVSNARGLLTNALAEQRVSLLLIDQIARNPRTSNAALEAALAGMPGRPDQPSGADAQSLEIRALLELRLGKLEAASESLATLAAVADSPAVRANRFRVALDRGDWPTALVLFEALNEGRLESASVVWRRAELLARAGRIDDAMEVVERQLEALAATEEEGGSATSEEKRGEVLRSGQTAVLSARTIGSGESGLHTLLTIAFEARDRGRHAESKRIFELAVARAPEAKTPREALVAYYATPEERDRHERELAERRGGLENPDDLFSAGTELLLRGDPAAALPLLERAASSRPHDLVFWRNYVLCALRLERWDTVIQAASHTSTLEPQNPEWYRYRGLALSKLNRCNEAIEPLELAIQVAPEEPGGYYDLARCLAELGRHKEVRTLVETGKRLEAEAR